MKIKNKINGNGNGIASFAPSHNEMCIVRRTCL
jgi:hypothetical protein